VKYSPAGNALWARTSTGSPSSDACYSISADPAGNVFLSGPYQSESITFGSTVLVNAAAPALDFYTVSYNSSGDINWAEGFGGIYDDAAYSICADSYGNLIAGGYFSSPSLAFGSIPLVNSYPGTEDLFIAKKTYSVDQTGITTKTTGKDLLIYPNPASSMLTVDFTNTGNTLRHLEIFNVDGKMMTSLTPAGDKVLVDVSEYPSGFYFVKVTTNSSVAQGKFCKE
jgi:hypothetical protein